MTTTHVPNLPAGLSLYRVSVKRSAKDIGTVEVVAARHDDGARAEALKAYMRKHNCGPQVTLFSKVLGKVS